MRYPGGKGGCFRHIVNLMPPHDVYIETHLGGGNVLEQKKPAARNIGVDVDQDLIAVWSDRIPTLGFPLDLHCADAVKFLRDYPFTGRELVYSDPPYLHETRRDTKLYRYEYTDEQHVELLWQLMALPCNVMVSGYRSSLYTTVLQGDSKWRCVEFQSMTRRGLATECLWFNFEPTTLHDVRFVGDDYRARERIKRKKNRWRKNFRAMSPAERQVILEALLEANA